MEKPKTLLLEEDFYNGLSRLNIPGDSIVLLHISMSAMGWVCGADVSIVNALIKWSESGVTLVMPSQTPDYSDPSLWSLPPVPEEWYDVIRNNMPPFVPQQTATKGIGAVAESFRRHAKVDRSHHPKYSFAAVGPLSTKILHPHLIDTTLAEGSPLHRLYQMNAIVLMIGTDWETCTAMHLSEYFSKSAKAIKNGAPIMENGNRKWVEYRDYDWDDTYFNNIGRHYLKEHPQDVQQFKLGDANCLLLNIKSLVDYSTRELSLSADNEAKK
jgi:aminoglycoside 3-N-acetyltransferase